MSSTKESNTSKTAHVMNLLSRTRGGGANGGASSETPAEPAAANPSGQQPAPTAQIAPILSSMEADAAVSSQIKDALESALEEDGATVSLKLTPPPQSAAPSDVTVQWPEWEEEGGEQPAAHQQPAPAPAPAAEVSNPAPAPIAETPPPAPAAPMVETPAATVQGEEEEKTEKDEIRYVNVMETLVAEKAEKYMEMFGMCCCPRCVVDVQAIALNSLPSKYVVMSSSEFIPRITVYEGRFSAAITAQLLRACRMVSEFPHHNREQQ